MAAFPAARMTLEPVARRLGMRPAARGARRWWDPLVILSMAWIFDAVNNLGAVHQTIAEHDGSAVLRVERILHAAPELALNTWLAAHHVLSEIVVFWYVNVHGVVTFAVFGWLWWRRPDLLGPLRAALIVIAAVALAVFWAMPVAPPRMLTTHGYVDLVAAVHHVPVWHGGNVALDANQLCALPSLHLAWAVWAAVAVWRMSARAWGRAAAVLYPFATLFAVMATGNHYLADGVAGAALAGVAVLSADRRWVRRRTVARYRVTRRRAWPNEPPPQRPPIEYVPAARLAGIVVRTEKAPPAPTRAKIAGTPANSCRGLNADESSVTVSPRGQPPRTEPKTRTLWPRRTAPGEASMKAKRLTRSVACPNTPPPQRPPTE